MPTYIEMIKTAINALKVDKNGVCSDDISKYIKKNFEVPNNGRFDCWLRKALKSGIDKGTLLYGSNKSRYKVRIISKKEQKKMENKKQKALDREEKRKQNKIGIYKQLPIENGKSLRCTECKHFFLVSECDHDLFVKKKPKEVLCRACIAWRGCQTCGRNGSRKNAVPLVYHYCQDCCAGFCEICFKLDGGWCLFCASRMRSTGIWLGERVFADYR